MHADQSGPALIVTSRIRVKPERRDEVVAAATRLAVECLNDGACSEFRVTADTADPSVIFLYEAWNDATGMTRCFQLEPMCEFKETLRRLKAPEPDVRRYRVA